MRSATAVLWLALACTGVAVAQQEEPEITMEVCQAWFSSLEDNMHNCSEPLSTLVEAKNASQCPPPCRGLFKDMPSNCSKYVNESMPASYPGPAIVTTFDVCDLLLFCIGDNCNRVLEAIQSLDLLADPYSTTWSRDWAQGKELPLPPSTSGSRVDVGLVVGCVVAANAVIAALVAGLVLLRRRRKKQRRLEGDGALEGGRSGLCADGQAAGMERGMEDSADLSGGGKQQGGKLGITIAAAATRAGSAGSPALQYALLPSPFVGSTHGLAASVGSSNSSSGSSSRIPAVTTPPHMTPDGLQDLAALWALAAQGAAAVPLLPEHMQADALEMMRLGSAAPSQQQQQQPLGSVPEDAQLPWTSSQQQQLTGSGIQSATPVGGSGRLSDSDRQQGSSSEQTAAVMSPGMSERRSSSSTWVDLKPWLVKYADLKVQRNLGEGSFGKVYLATWNETLVAVKILLPTDEDAASARAADSNVSFSSPGMEALQKEAGLMASLRHPNVVLFLGVCTSPPAVVTEYCSRGSLLDVLRAAHMSEQGAAQLPWLLRLKMALDAAKGMLCLHAHSPPILHRDLKSPNLLVDAAWRVKVCDFNLSKLLEDSSRSSTAGAMMNPRWLAPEVLTGQSATAASDVFSFGVVLWELLTWQLPWEGINLYQLVFMVSRGTRLQVPPLEQVPGVDQLWDYDAYVALMHRCWAQEQAERPSFADVIGELRAIIGRTRAAAASNATAIATAAA